MSQTGAQGIVPYDEWEATYVRRQLPVHRPYVPKLPVEEPRDLGTIVIIAMAILVPVVFWLVALV